MQKLLKKAHSSIMRFPKIPSKKKLNNIYNSTNYNFPKKETFLTINTDDIGFAKLQNNLIDKKINNIIQSGIQVWKKEINNNIYSPSWTSNKKIIKNIKTNALMEKGDNFNSIKLDNHKKYFKKETENIFNTYSTAKNYKFKNELKKKYAKLDTNTDNLIYNTKKLCFNNYMLDLLKNERNKINIKELGYKDSLKKEDFILSKDIKNFENYKSQENIKLKNLENELMRKINENGAIFELVKQYSHEHRVILDEIKRQLKNIIKYKNYALFIYKLLGIDSSILSKSDLGEKIMMTGSLKENEIEQVIKKVYFQTQKLFDKNFDSIIEELYSDPLKIYTVIINKENMILNLLADKENINFERNISSRDYKKEIEIYEKKYNNYMNEYIMYLEELEVQTKKVQSIEPNRKLYEFHHYLYNLFFEIKKSLIPEEKQKRLSKNSLLYYNLVIPCLKELQKKELLINKLIKDMEFYEKNDKKLFDKQINITKLDNKEKKFLEERELLKIKDIEEREKILRKCNQIIITGKYKYKLPLGLNRINSFSKNINFIKKSNNI